MCSYDILGRYEAKALDRVGVLGELQNDYPG